MKKNLLNLGLFAMGAISFANRAEAQIFFTQDFEGAVEANGLPTGWTETGLSTDGIYYVGTDADANSAGYWPAPAHTLFAQSNDDACNCDKSEDRLILPVQDFTSYVAVNLIADIYMDGNYSSTGNVEVSTDGGTTWTSVYTMPLVDGTWQDNTTISLNAYAGMANVSIAFRFNDNGAWASGLGVDNVRLESVGGGADLETVSASSSEYTIIPVSQATALPLIADVDNVGTVDITDAVLTANVYLSTDLVNALQSTSSSATAIDAGMGASLDAGSFLPSAEGIYVFEYIIGSSETDVNTSNDTLYTSIEISGTEYARDNGLIAGAYGIGAGPTGYLGTTFTIVNAAELDSVMIALNKGGTDVTPGDGVGDSTRVTIFNMAGGLPTTIIGESPVYIFTGADTNGVVVSTHEIIATGGGNLMLAPGDYFVAVNEYNTNVGMAYSNDIFTNATSYASWDGQPWTAVETFGAGFAKAMVIRPLLVAEEISGIAENSETAFEMYPNPTSGDLTITSEAVVEKVKIFNMLGELVQVEKVNSFSVANLPSGVYLVELHTSKGISNSRLVKK